MKSLPRQIDKNEINERYLKLLDDVFSDTSFLFNQMYEYAKDAEFMKYTTGRMEDGFATLNVLKSVLINVLKVYSIEDVKYLSIVETNKTLLLPLLEVAKRHHFRGVTLDFYLQCWKIIVHGVEDKIRYLKSATSDEILNLLFLTRRVYDACETIFINEWADVQVDTLQEALMENTRKMTFEKCKYQNVFEGTSDFMIIVDKNGKIEELNKAAKEYFQSKNIDYNNICICEVLNKNCNDIFSPSFLKTFEEPKPITLFGREYFMLKIVSLKDIALNYDRYLIVLSDVTGLTVRNKILEMEVFSKTKELVRSKKFLNSVFTSTNTGIIILDSKLKIYSLNYSAMQTLQLKGMHLNSIDIDKFMFSSCEESLSEITSCLNGENSWSGELVVNLDDRDIYIMANINAIEIDREFFYSLIFIDISKVKQLEEQLLNEKKLVEEKNITLKNVIQTLTQDNKKSIDELLDNINNKLAPMLDGIVIEKSLSERQEQKNHIIRWLMSYKADNLTSDASINDSGLTYTENQVCELIKIGFSTKEIAEKLNVSIDTVHTHRKNIRKKLGLSDKNINLYSYIKSNF